MVFWRLGGLQQNYCLWQKACLVNTKWTDCAMHIRWKTLHKSIGLLYCKRPIGKSDLNLLLLRIAPQEWAWDESGATRSYPTWRPKKMIGHFPEILSWHQRHQHWRFPLLRLLHRKSACRRRSLLFVLVSTSWKGWALHCWIQHSTIGLG